MFSGCASMIQTKHVNVPQDEFSAVFVFEIRTPCPVVNESFPIRCTASIEYPVKFGVAQVKSTAVLHAGSLSTGAAPSIAIVTALRPVGPGSAARALIVATTIPVV